MAKPGRNAPCPCGSGKKYKNCCLKKGYVSPPPGEPEPLPGLGALFKSNWLLVSGLVAGGLTLFSALEGLLWLASWAKWILSIWQLATHWVWDTLFFWLKVPLHPITKNALTMLLLLDGFTLRAVYLLRRKGEQESQTRQSRDLAKQLTLYAIGVVAISIVIVVLPSASATGPVLLSWTDLIVVGLFLLASMALQKVRGSAGVMGTYYVNVLLFGSLSICGLLVLLNLLFEWQHYLKWLFGLGQ